MSKVLVKPEQTLNRVTATNVRTTLQAQVVCFPWAFHRSPPPQPPVWFVVVKVSHSFGRKQIWTLARIQLIFTTRTWYRRNYRGEKWRFQFLIRRFVRRPGSMDLIRAASISVLIHNKCSRPHMVSSAVLITLEFDNNQHFSLLTYHYTPYLIFITICDKDDIIIDVSSLTIFLHLSVFLSLSAGITFLPALLTPALPAELPPSVLYLHLQHNRST